MSKWLVRRKRVKSWDVVILEGIERLLQLRDPICILLVYFICVL